MSTVLEKQPSAPSPPANRVVDEQILRTRRTLKGVDATAGLITLVIGVLSYLLLVAISEHWLVPGGWSPALRGTLFAILVLGVAWYCWRVFWPLVWQPINPAYAAQAIEQSSPSLKNSLLNLLLLRGHRKQLPQQVYQAIEQQAAQRLSKVPLDSVVDRSVILRLGYVLVAVVALGTLYRIFSPKDPLASAARVLLPWSEIAVPSRVQILDVTPGETSVARGEQLEISAELLGLEPDEPVRLLYSTSDEQRTDQEIRMTVRSGGSRFQCRLPGSLGAGDASGIQQDLTYWIEAGDARSPQYQVTVFARPTLVVSRLRYDYPAYTGYGSTEVEHTGDISALEGTIVTLIAQANQPIKQAHVDFAADGKHDLLMNSEKREASVAFPLQLQEDRRTPLHQSYVLRYRTKTGRTNQSPPKYQIDVIPDYAPEVQLLEPEQAMLEVKIDEPVAFAVEARDPDFAVSDVTLYGEVAGEGRLEEKLLTQDHQGRFVGRLRQTPAEMGLQVGEVMEYWAAAADNRRPQANVTVSVRRKLRVIDSEQGDQQGEAGQQQGDPHDGQQGEQQPEGGASPEGDAGDEQGEQQSPQSQSGEQEQTEPGEEGGAGEGGLGQQGSSENSEPGEQQGEGVSSDSGEQNSENDSSAGAGGDSRESGDANENSSEPTPGENSQSKPGEQGENQGTQDKVSAEGDDDGTAFERMAEHLEQQEGDATGEGQTRDASAEEINSGAGRTEQNNGNAEESGSEAQPGAENSDAEGAKPQQGTEPGAEGEPTPQQEEDSSTRGEDSAETATDGKMSQEQGNAGEGENPGENQGIPEQDPKKPRDKTNEPGAEGKQNDQEAAAESKGKTESDSDGSQGGDRSGGGQEGAGQQADDKGTGGAGENQAAEEGGSQADQQGEGQTGNEAGDQQPADGKTGESSQDQPGAGSETAEGAGQQPPGAEGENPQQQQPGEQPPEGQPGTPSTKPGEGQHAPGKPSAANQHPQGGEGGDSAPPPQGETLPGDEANLEYARKKTDLVLERIEDQLEKQQVDQELLDKLGWNEDELRRFVERWKNLKAEAESPAGSEEAQQELDDSLRSLGLVPKNRMGFRSKTVKDRLRDLQDAYRGRTPLEYQERVRAYVKGTASESD